MVSSKNLCPLRTCECDLIENRVFTEIIDLSGSSTALKYVLGPVTGVLTREGMFVDRETERRRGWGDTM